MKPAFTGLAAALALGLAAGAAKAADWPRDVVTIVVPYAPGNITDIAARLIAQNLTETTGASVVVENRAGASTQIGTHHVARAAGDGRTLLLTGAIFATNPALFENMQYDSANDLTPVALVVSNPLVLVTAASTPFETFEDLSSHARANPEEVTVASGGSGTLSHMALALLAGSADLELSHIPYSGGGAAAIDTLGGHVDAMWDNPSSAIPRIQEGALRGLAVSGLERNPALPEVPTVHELGIEGFEVINWFGLFAPGTTEPELLDAIHASVQVVMEDPDFIERFAREGVTAGGASRAEFAAFVASETEKWGAIIRENDIRPD